MCGIVGLWNTHPKIKPDQSNLSNMLAQIPHRGPDSDGYAINPEWGLSQNRLSIVDLENGNQPVWNSDKSAVIVGNNEIYNASELRHQLIKEGYRFRTRCDTEVILAGWTLWEEEVFSRLNGMFAVAIVDLQRRICVLARDPMGIKPLHWKKIGRGVAFASEIKSLLALERPKLNRDALHLFMNFRYIPTQETLFDGIHRIEPGSFRVLGKDTTSHHRYFSISQTSFKGSFDDAVEETAQLLPSAVKRHLVSDVEVATYLSGGIDSSMVSTLAAREIPSIRTYCIRFGEPSDEHEDAIRIAKNIGSRHETISIAESPLDNLKRTIWNVEEPKVNSLQGFALAREVSKDVKVALSGLGGDELYGGYVNNDILNASLLLRKAWPFSGRSMSGVQQFFPNPKFDHYFRMMDLGLHLRDPLQFYIILRNGFDHNKTLLSQIYGKYPSHWHGYCREALKPLFDSTNPDTLNEWLRLEARTKLINDFLLTEDRVSMAHSLEVRVPLLDKELIQSAFSYPSHFHCVAGQKKRILREVARDYLPDSALQKTKWGFSFNPHLLFSTQLKGFAEACLTRSRVEELGFSWKWVNSVLTAPPSPKLRWHYFNLWVMTGFTLWYDLFFKGDEVGVARQERPERLAALDGNPSART